MHIILWTSESNLFTTGAIRSGAVAIRAVTVVIRTCIAVVLPIITPAIRAGLISILIYSLLPGPTIIEVVPINESRPTISSIVIRIAITVIIVRTGLAKPD